MKKTQKIAIMTSGGDCPDLNPAIRAVVKTAIPKYGLEVRSVCLGD
jgi:6-phosphofructokinase 1